MRMQSRVQTTRVVATSNDRQLLNSDDVHQPTFAGRSKPQTSTERQRTCTVKRYWITTVAANRWGELPGSGENAWRMEGATLTLSDQIAALS
jgi:hypothetical protein